uniref:hypothetical protein n=1 Tax=Phocaeicola sp. TaxID=2773926 RepID=UPI003AB31BDC
VGTALDRVTDEVHVLGLGVCGVVVEAVVAPVAGVGNRTRYEGFITITFLYLIKRSLYIK